MQEFLSGAGFQETQQRIMRALVENGRQTRFGRHHGFEGITDIADYRASVPIRDSHEWRTDFDAIVAGHGDVLSTSPVHCFISSSGSTGSAPKVLPMTERFVQEAFSPFYRLCLQSLNRRHPFVHPQDDTTLNLKADPLRHRPRLSNGQEHVGLSQVDFARDFEGMNQEPGARSEWVQVPPELDAESDRLLAKVVKSAGQPVRTLVGINPRTIVNLVRLVARQGEDVIESVRTGCFRGHRLTPPRPDIAAGLASRAASGELAPSDIWPQLQLVVAWTEGMAGSYLPHLRSLFGAAVSIVEAPLGSSEAPLTVPLYDGQPGGLLAWHTVHYEFLILAGERKGMVVGADELREGDCCSVIVSQQSGLYRYHLRDIVRVQGHLNGIPRLSYEGRHAAHRSLQEHELLDDVRRATRHAPIVAFSSMPLPCGGWRVWIEFCQDVPTELKVGACHGLCDRLSTRLYEARAAQTAASSERTPALLDIVEVGRDGFHHDWLSRLRAGKRAPQVKDLITTDTPPDTGEAGLLTRCQARIG